MLLRHTTAEVTSREALTVNPAKTCQPIGAMYAALGIHRCLPHSHGSQGCCAYHRSTLTRHYKEPVMAATSSFTEGSSVFGGQSNLLQALHNIFTIYDPDVVAVHTTCLSETIGDDINQIVTKARDDGKIPAGKLVIHANTPSYVGSHVTGFANMVHGMVDYLAQACQPARQNDQRDSRLGGTARICGNSSDLAACLGIDIDSFPRHFRCARYAADRSPSVLPAGRNVTLDHLRHSGASRATLALGPSASAPAAKLLETRHGVPYHPLELPIGLRATDRLINTWRKAARADIPTEIADERGRLIDWMVDSHQYFHGRRVALWGDPDQLVSLCEFLVDLGMRPVYVVTGTPGRQFERRLQTVLSEKVPEAQVRQGAGADMFLMHQWIKQESVDLLIGNTYGKYIARDDDIPLVRHGFPDSRSHGASVFPDRRVPRGDAAGREDPVCAAGSPRSRLPGRSIRTDDVASRRPARVRIAVCDSATCAEGRTTSVVVATVATRWVGNFPRSGERGNERNAEVVSEPFPN